MKAPLLWATACLFALCAHAEETVVHVANFSSSDLSGWQSRVFSGETDYQLKDGALCASSEGTASGRYRELRLNLQHTPWLNWRWRVDSGIEPERQEQTKKGDDYPARVYVVFSAGIQFWKTRALNYVWSSSQPVGSNWPNAFTGNARMIAVQSGSNNSGRWQQERRNVAEDYYRLFGEAPPRVSAVAIMTDTDNSGAKASACYGDIWFSSH